MKTERMALMEGMKTTLALLLALAATDAVAQTVYKSVDANGNIIYSDTPPQDSLLLETLTLQRTEEENGADQQSQALIDQMANVTDRLKQDREDRTKARQAQQPAPNTPPLIYREEYYYQDGDPYYRYPYPGYYPYRGPYPYRPHRPHKRPRYDDPQWRSGRDLNNDAILVPRSKLLTPGRDK
ncbi:MAG: DUF4124 domain-containing protein [Gammaproteobacteria bacterium]|nr:MAG: DUF4124 domain-containing protein [Gammaproteobacteria bacterium]